MTYKLHLWFPKPGKLRLLLLDRRFTEIPPSFSCLCWQTCGLPTICRRIYYTCTLRAIQVSVLRCFVLLGQTSQCTDSELALGGNNRNLLQLFAQICVMPHLVGTMVLLFILHFKNSSTDQGDEQQKANPKHLKMSRSPDNHETLCFV